MKDNSKFIYHGSIPKETFDHVFGVGYDAGTKDGFQVGFEKGEIEGTVKGREIGYEQGYKDGLEHYNTGRPIRGGVGEPK